MFFEKNLEEIDFILLSLNENLNFEEFTQKILRTITSFNREKLFKYINEIINKILKYVKSFGAKKNLLLIVSSIILSVTAITSKEFIREIENPNAINFYKTELIVNDRTEFLKKLAFKESSNTWDTVNQFGYMGLFQFGEMALKDVGMSHIKVKDFKKNPNIFPVEKQMEAINKLINNNIKYIGKYIKYDGKTINGISITKSGMVAAAHLVGASSVKKFLKSNGKIDPVDGNGVRCSHYIKEFGGYNIDKSNVVSILQKILGVQLF